MDIVYYIMFAEDEGLEPPRAFDPTIFKTVALPLGKSSYNANADADKIRLKLPAYTF